MQGFKASQEDVMKMGYVLGLETGLGLGSAPSSCPRATPIESFASAFHA